MFEESTLGIASMDLEGRFLEANRAYAKLFGYCNEELRALRLLDLVVEEDWHDTAELLNQLSSGTRHDFQIESGYRRKDGRTIWIHNTVSLIPSTAESGSFIATIVKDITTRKNAEDILKKQNEAFHKIFDNVPVMLSFVARDGSIKLVNREWERTIGWSLSEILTEDLDIFALCYPDPDYRQKALRFVAESESEWVEFKTKTRDGRTLDTIWAVVKLSDGTSLGIGRDITAAKQAEEALQRSQAYLAAGQRLSHTGSWAWNLVTHELFWSQETFRIFDVSPDTPSADLIATFLQRVHPEDRPPIAQALREAAAQVQGYSADYRILLPDRSIKYIHDVVYPVTNGAGQVVERYGVAMDVTSRKLSEQERQRSFDQLRALTARVQDAREEERTRVAREIHDELGQALTSIKIDLSGLLHEDPAKPEQIRKIEAISNVIDQTIKDVRRISSELRPWILDDLGLTAAIEWAVEEFEARTGTRCRLSLPENDSVIDSVRATAIFRILQETLTNVARHANARNVDVLLEIEPSGVILEVRDDGRGATLEQLAALESLGIRGMRERVFLLGGELSIAGISGRGTKVRIRIPLAESPALGG